MRRKRGLKERFLTWVFGSKEPAETYPDMGNSPCQKCKIMTAYMKLTEKAVKLDLEANNQPFTQTSFQILDQDQPRYPRNYEEVMK